MDFDESNELDPDLLMDMPSPSHGGLGGLQGFGNALDGDEEEEHGYNGHLQNGSQVYDDHDLDVDDQQPLRRSANHYAEGSSTSRHSLAFELANAMEPTHTGSNLLQELGIEEEEEEGSTYNDVSSVTIASEITGMTSLSKSSRRASSPSAAHDPPASPTSSSGRTLLRKSKSRASQASLRPHTNGFTESTASRQVQEDETASIVFDHGIASLETSMATTRSFLEHIHDYGANVDAPLESSAHDRQPALETLLNSFIKTLYECAKLREEQCKVLADTQKSFDDPDATWHAAFADLEPLPVYTPFADPSSVQSHLLDTVEEESEEAVPGSPSRDASQEHPPISPSLARLVLHDLADVRLVTDSLVDSLASIGEHTQVSRSTNVDAARKFKAITGGLSGLRSEAESVERSQSYIAEWERRELADVPDSSLRQSALPGLSSAPRRRQSSNNSTASTTSLQSKASGILSGKYSEQVRQEMKAALSLLEVSHTQARVLLADGIERR